MKKTITIVLGMVVIATAINYCDPGGFDKDHEVAMQIATQIQKQCKNAHVCPVDIAKIQIGPETGHSSILDELPKLFEYRLTTPHTSFVVGYKGGMDPDCAYVIFGGVSTDIRKSLLCETDAWAKLRKTYAVLWKSAR